MKESFNTQEYTRLIHQASEYIRGCLPLDFMPRWALTLGSGGLGGLVDLIQPVGKAIPYTHIPGFRTPTVEGHKGNIVAGYFEGVPILIMQGRYHFYETGGEPTLVSAMRSITFPVCVLRDLGIEIYFATNAAGALNTDYKKGDIMFITSHMGLLLPNPLLGPCIDFMNAPSFQPQHTQYNARFIEILLRSAGSVDESKNVHQGVYAAVPGRTYESRSESYFLRQIGVDAVGMSTIPEIIVASNIGMETIGLSLISNVISPDGTNPTSNEEVMDACRDEAVQKRITLILKNFFQTAHL